MFSVRSRFCLKTILKQVLKTMALAVSTILAACLLYATHTLAY